MTWQILPGDARQRLADLPAASVQTCVTSPPYFGLRDYGTAAWDGGDPTCGHRVTGGGPSMLQGASQRGRSDVARGDCPTCGATRIDSQIGLEPTPDAYVAELVAVFRQVRRVLRDDGTLWLNLADSYAAGPMSASEQQGQRSGGTLNGRYGHVDNVGLSQRRSLVPAGLKPKDLIGIPWRVAFALQADGWYLRSDIIWHKPNPMPESVTDRPTKAHEYLFLLTKSARYYYDAEAIRATVSGGDPSAGRNKRSVWTVPTQPYPEAHFATFPEALIEPCVLAGSRPDDLVLDPFAGSGTTGVVAIGHQRAFVGVELNPAYCELARRRIGDVAPLFAREVA